MRLSLIDVNGKEVQRLMIAPMDASVKLNLENVNPGIYFIQSNGVYETKKLIIK